MAHSKTRRRASTRSRARATSRPRKSSRAKRGKLGVGKHKISKQTSKKFERLARQTMSVLERDNNIF